MEIWIGLVLFMFTGPLFGLIPFTVGRNRGKRSAALLALICSAISGFFLMQIPVAIGFVIAITVTPRDFGPWVRRTPVPQSVSAPRATALGLTCLSGPMKGRTYIIGERGILMGRSQDCAICFDASSPGISRHHCALRWQAGNLMLTDLDSAYGTYLSGSFHPSTPPRSVPAPGSTWEIPAIFFKSSLRLDRQSGLNNLPF